jgi:hypothetical protein
MLAKKTLLPHRLKDGKRMNTAAKEPLLKGTAQYGWPPSNNWFGSARFYIEKLLIFFFKETINQNLEVNCTEPFPLSEGSLLQSIEFLSGLIFAVLIHIKCSGIKYMSSAGL